MPEPQNPTYLGDGVYASTSGGMLALHLNRHDTEPVVYLEAEVMDALDRYAEQVWPGRKPPQRLPL